MNILHIRLINLILVSGDLCRLALLCHHFYSCHKTVIVFWESLSCVDQGTHKYVGCSFSVLRVNTNLHDTTLQGSEWKNLGMRLWSFALWRNARTVVMRLSTEVLTGRILWADLWSRLIQNLRFLVHPAHPMADQDDNPLSIGKMNWMFYEFTENIQISASFLCFEIRNKLVRAGNRS